MPGSMRLTFLVSLIGMALLFVTLWKYELASKHATFQLRALKRKLARRGRVWAPNPRRSAAPHALMPALPLDEAGKYVAAAYLVFLALILIYVAIMAGRLSRIEKDLGEVTELLERRTAEDDREPVAR